MKRIIPYGIRIGESGKTEAIPIARAVIRAAGGRQIPVIFLIDSGATASLLPATDAEALAIEMTSGEKISLRGISGDVMVGYRHHLRVNLEGFSIPSVPIVFATRSDVPRVLGRAGIFPRFVILFDEAKRRTGWLDGKERKAVDFIFR